MGRNMIVNLGIQQFDTLMEEQKFYVDKTGLIREWLEYGSSVTLITRPRRFGKTLNMSMLECFFSKRYAGRGDLFEGLSIWEEKSSEGAYKYRHLQGAFPVIFMSFAPIKTGNIEAMKTGIKQIITNLYSGYREIMASEIFQDEDRRYFESVRDDMDDKTAIISINRLCSYLERYYDEKVIVLLDEYDTPIQEAWMAGTWDETMDFFRNFFNHTFKTNSHLYRGMITGITRVSRESIFSDLNNLEVATITSDKYATAFGFTEEEVFRALDDAGLGSEKQKVKTWYDGFIFGSYSDIYNPWSIASFISNKGKYSAYWVNTSSNGLVNTLVQKGDAEIKKAMEDLLCGNSIVAEIDEQIAFDQLEEDPNAVWSLLLTTGYLKVLDTVAGACDNEAEEEDAVWYRLALTNYEVKRMFRKMIRRWFNGRTSTSYNNFLKALLLNDVEEMNEYMNRIALNSFSNFDTAKSASSDDAPERFYHGFVLGLMVELSDRFEITSNRESGFGRYDIMLTPINIPNSPNQEKDCAYIIEFKVHKPKKEKSLEETVANALSQIDEKHYEAQLVSKGFTPDQIKKYGFAFRGKECLIGCKEEVRCGC